jgi:hypothetical protein
VTEINLSENRIDADGAAALANALKANATVTTINLRQNAICAEGAYRRLLIR